MSNVQYTSLLAYMDVLQDLGDKQRQVFKALCNIQPASNRQIALYLGWSINRVTPRVLELRKLGKVTDWGFISECGRRVFAWKIA